jgi:CO/xanthine dehydrogenase FAD-binding subunit
VTINAYFTPESLEEALSLKASHGYDLHVIAGGTLMMPQINDGLFFPKMVMGLRRAGMDGVAVNGTAVIGATATMTRMEGLSGYPILQQAAHSIGGWAVRNMATVGGNLFNQPPYGDFCVALLALDAQVKIQSAGSERVVSVNDFLSGGLALEAGELITEIHVPKPTGLTAFRKFGRRQANAATIITVAAHLDLADGQVSKARIALGGADRTSKRSPAAEELLINTPLSPSIIAAAAKAAAGASNPVTDAVASAWYRRQMIEVQLKRTLSELLGV